MAPKKNFLSLKSLSDNLVKILLTGIENSAASMASLIEFPSPFLVIFTFLNSPFTPIFSVVL